MSSSCTLFPFPLQSPDLFKSGKLDGPTLHAVFYFTLKEETAKALQDLESAEPSVRLLADFFRLVAVCFFGVEYWIWSGVVLRRAGVYRCACLCVAHAA